MIATYAIVTVAALMVAVLIAFLIFRFLRTDELAQQEGVIRNKLLLKQAELNRMLNSLQPNRVRAEALIDECVNLQRNLSRIETKKKEPVVEHDDTTVDLVRS